MKTKSRCCALLIAGLLFSGCPEDEHKDSLSIEEADAGPWWQSDDTLADTGTDTVIDSHAGMDAGAPALPAPFEQSFDHVITQDVQWASVDVRITGARQVGKVNTDINTFEKRVELDLELVNKSDEEVDYRNRDTWDLLLADGTRLTQSGDLGDLYGRLLGTTGLNVLVLPGDTAKTTVSYPIDELVDLEGAKLVLEGSTRGELEPEYVPLDAMYVREYPRIIPSLVGQKYEQTGGESTVEIKQAYYDVNVDRESRAELGKRVVWMTIVVTCRDAEYCDWSADDARIVVNGLGAEPINYEVDDLEHDTSETYLEAFELDSTATDFDITLPADGTDDPRFSARVADTQLAP